MCVRRMFTLLGLRVKEERAPRLYVRGMFIRASVDLY